jgi:hypothetical protein
MKEKGSKGGRRAKWRKAGNRCKKSNDFKAVRGPRRQGQRAIICGLEPGTNLLFKNVLPFLYV